MATFAPRRRATPRVAMELDVTLSRSHGRGNAVVGRTTDLGPGGMCVTTKRPLKLDEQLEFDVALRDGTRVAGRAHVVRAQAREVYALCFDAIGGAESERLWQLTTR